MVSVRIKWRRVLLCLCLTLFYFKLVSYILMDDKLFFLYRRNVFGNVSKMQTKSPGSGSNTGNYLPVKLEADANNCNDHGCMSYDVLIIVKSFVLNYGKRNVIRQTWGKNKNNVVRTIFVIGEYKNNDTLLKTELHYFKDIIVLGLEDVYENLVYKTINVMKWISVKRIKARFFHFIDDDRILNIDNLLNVANKHLGKNDVKIIGYKISWSKPRRKPKNGKNVLTIEEYPFFYYPPYIIGGTLLTNLRTIQIIAQSVPFIKVISVEDCYIGMVSYALSIELVHDSGFIPYFTSSTDMHAYISAPGYDQPHHLLMAWNAFLNSTLRNDH